jgi:hypothetical protein
MHNFLIASQLYSVSDVKVQLPCIRLYLNVIQFIVRNAKNDSENMPQTLETQRLSDP